MSGFYGTSALPPDSYQSLLHETGRQRAVESSNAHLTHSALLFLPSALQRAPVAVHEAISNMSAISFTRPKF